MLWILQLKYLSYQNNIKAMDIFFFSWGVAGGAGLIEAGDHDAVQFSTMFPQILTWKQYTKHNTPTALQDIFYT